MASLRRQNGIPDNTEMCPVCKSSSYLNKNLKFKVNPECYHRMCTSCVDRIFSSGPAPCPVAGCGKTLRKNRFKEPRFSDLTIERECDIRARVATILNLQEVDFGSLREFNDYEEQKEETIMDLVAGRNVEKIEKKLKEFAAEYKEQIKANAQHEKDTRLQTEEDEKLRIERSRRARVEAQREYAEELAEREAGRREVVDKIVNAHTNNVRGIAKEAAQTVQRRAAARQQASVANESINENGGSSDANTRQIPSRDGDSSKITGFRFAGLVKPQVKTVEPHGPYDPFAGIMLKLRYHSLAERYEHHSNQQCSQKGYASGGYSAKDYQQRCLLDAHAGLGVFVDEDKS